MASEFRLTAPDRRIVLLSKTGSAQTKVVRAVLREEELKGASEECVIYEEVRAGRKICLVNTPGWDTVSTDGTFQKMKNEIIRSVTLCPPGPHAVIVVLPLNPDDALSLNDLNEAIQHMELLSERVWNHSMVLFLCDQYMDQSSLNKHMEMAVELLLKCRGRHHVLRISENSETQIHELFKKIDEMVVENSEEHLIPPVYYNIIQSVIKAALQSLNEQDGREDNEGKPRHRRQSLEILPPKIEGDDQTGVSDIREVVRSVIWEDVLLIGKYIFKPALVIGLAVIGALFGSLVGSEYGVAGAGLGILIGLLLTLVSLKMIDALKVFQ